MEIQAALSDETQVCVIAECGAIHFCIWRCEAAHEGEWPMV